MKHSVKQRHPGPKRAIRCEAERPGIPNTFGCLRRGFPAVIISIAAESICTTKPGAEKKNLESTYRVLTASLPAGIKSRIGMAPAEMAPFLTGTNIRPIVLDDGLTGSRAMSSSERINPGVPATASDSEETRPKLLLSFLGVCN